MLQQWCYSSKMKFLSMFFPLKNSVPKISLSRHKKCLNKKNSFSYKVLLLVSANNPMDSSIFICWQLRELHFIYQRPSTNAIFSVWLWLININTKAVRLTQLITLPAKKILQHKLGFPWTIYQWIQHLYQQTCLWVKVLLASSTHRLIWFCHGTCCILYICWQSAWTPARDKVNNKK